MSSDHSNAPGPCDIDDLTAARIAAIAAHVPAHPTSLGMQVLAEDKLRMRMKIQQQSTSTSSSSSKSVSKKESSSEVVNALGWILNEWVLLLESRRRSGSYHSHIVNSPTNSPAFISRLREIARGLLADPNAGCGPVEAVAVHDAGTAIPATDLDAIIARIPNAVAPIHPIIDGGSDDGDIDGDDLTEEQRLEEEELIEINRRRKAEQVAQGIVHDTAIPPEILAALDEMPQ